MRSSLSLQRSLYAHQKKQIAALVQSASPGFRAYERRYQRATSSYRRLITPEDVVARLAAADLVYVGDYHTLRLAQQTYLELVQQALTSGRRVVLALEFVEGKSQAHLDAYLAGRLSERTFLKRISHPYRGPFDIWPSFKAILGLARQHRLEVIAIDRRATGPRSLETRDRFAATQIAAAARAADRPQILVLMGQFHIAPAHLPRRVEVALGRTARRGLIVYQNAEGLWWKLAARGLTEARAVELSPSALCLISASPVVCQRSFLDYVEAEAGDAPLEESGLANTLNLMVRDLSKLVGASAVDAGELHIVTAAQLDVMRSLVERGRFSAKEIRHLERHVLSRESALIPRARTVWLASLSLNHAAEEAAHYVRFRVIGAAMERPRPRSAAFWARVYEEALGFFGSRLVNPARRCTQLPEWASIFAERREGLHQTAAFVLALHAALQESPAATRRLIPRGLELFNSTTHALGYLLGDALARAFAEGQVSRAQLRGLFSDRLEQPVQACFELLRRVGGGPKATVESSSLTHGHAAARHGGGR